MATIRVIKTENEFLALKPQWDSLVAKNPALTVFQTFDWNYNVWTHYYKQVRPMDRLYILCANRDGNEEDAILPFCIARSGTVEIIGQTLSDICSEICAQHHGNWHSFYHDIYEFIRADKNVQRISFSQLEANSELLRYFSVYMANARVRTAGAYTYVHMPQTDEIKVAFEYLGQKDRSRIKALEKKFRERRFKIFNIKNDSFPVDQLMMLRRHMCESGKRFESFMPSAMVDLLRAEYQIGACEIATFLKDDGSLEFAAFRLLHDKRVNFWGVLYKEERDTSGVYIAYMMNKLATSDYAFDFGVGVYGYKLGTFRPEVCPLFRLDDHPRTGWNFCRDVIEIFRMYVKTWLEAVSPRAVRFVKMVLAFCRGDNRRK